MHHRLYLPRWKGKNNETKENWEKRLLVCVFSFVVFFVYFLIKISLLFLFLNKNKNFPFVFVFFLIKISLLFFFKICFTENNSEMLGFLVP